MRLTLDPTPEEREAIYGWIEASPDHAVAFARAETAWDSAERLKASRPEDLAGPAPDSSGWYEPPTRMTDRVFMSAVIAIALFIAAAIVTVWTLNDVDRYSTKIGEVKDIALSDGSRLHLNSDSVAEVRYSDRGRRVRILKGEASFDVVHDKLRPFDVEAQSASIRSIGTEFNVRLRPSIVELTVTHGAVQVHSGKAVPHRVGAGAGAVICIRTIALTRLGQSVIDQRTAWRNRMVQLDGGTIEQAVAEFNRYRTKPLLIGDPRVSSLRMDGRFGTGQTQEFLSSLQMSLPVRAMTGSDGQIMLLYRDEPHQD